MRYLLPLPIVALITLVAVGRDSPRRDHLTHRTAAGIVYTVTADGLSEVHRDGKVLAKGGWRFRPADRRWGFATDPDADKITAKSIKVVSPTVAEVTHTQGQVVARYTFTFNGEDVRIESWVENHHPTAVIQVAGFEGPRITFGKVPYGILPNWHSSYTAANGIPLMHPGGIRVGGSYAVGDGFGVGVAPHGAGIHPTAVLWDYDWTKKEADPNRTPWLFVRAPIPAGGARTFAVTFRFSTNTDWTHLLDPYRKHLHATLGEKLLYDAPDNRPYVAGFAMGTEAQRGPTNPYAYEPHRRLDSINGVDSYHAWLAPEMRAINAQGLVLWGQGGLHPRGAMYRPDFDILPPDVVPNFKRFAGLFKEQRMRLGVTARPGQRAEPLDWAHDTVSWIHPDLPDELGLLTWRFHNMIALGASLFYLDSAGNRIDDLTILRAVRTGVGKRPGIGRSVQTFVEHPSDVIVPVSGLLPVLIGNAAEGTVGVAFVGAFWLDPPKTPSMTELLRYFYPDVPIVCLIQVQGVDTVERKRDAIEYCLKRRMTPMIPDAWLVAGTGEWLGPLLREYLTDEGKWK
jgi:hypothetical protein